MHPMQWITEGFERIQARRKEKAARRNEHRILRKRVEEAVAATEPNIRMAKGYQARLMPAVKNALEHCRTLTEKLPGPFDIRPDRWGRDPLVTAYFATIEELRNALETCPALQRRFSGTREQEAHALLTMKTEEKQVYRKSSRGALLQQEVPKTSVNFFRHRFTSVHASLAELQQDLRRRACRFLLSCALEQMAALQSEEERLAHKKEVLDVQWRLQQSREKDIGALMDGFDGSLSNGAARRILEEVHQELDSVRSRIDEPSDFLGLLEQVLQAPERYLKMTLAAPRLDQMGIKVRETDPDPGSEIPYAVLSFGAADFKRAAVLARVFRQDVLDESATRRQAPPAAR